MAPSPSLAGRALAAVVLMIGFYVLAIGMAIGLLAIPFAEAKYAERVHPRIVLFCVAGAGVVLWSVLPRRDRFTAPGPRLDASRDPQLFESVRDIAARTGEAMPSDVFLVHDVNAWVAQRGGVMGFGGERVMGLGLPLLQVLTVDELRAVIAHEFGHYAAGDTRLGPWVYKTREALFRTLINLEEHSSLIKKPFELYARLFLRVTLAISRAQERGADALAAAIAGPRALATGLIEVHRSAAAYDAYWRTEVEPILERGFHPPIAEGFGHFMAVESVTESLSRYMEEARSAASDPYDSHPSLIERLNQLGEPLDFDSRDPGPAAITLVSDPTRLESELTQFLTQPADAESVHSSMSPLVPLSWQEVGDRVLLPQWQRMVETHGAALRDLTPTSFVDLAGRLDAFGNSEPWTGWGPIQRKVTAGNLLGSALSVTLDRSGWTLDAMPGDPVSYRKADYKVNPFQVLGQLESGELTPESWLGLCAASGIAGAPLAPPAGQPPRA